MSRIYCAWVNKTYLVLTNRKQGLLLNFGMETMKAGIKRVINGAVPDLRDSVAPCDKDRFYGKE